MKAMVRDIAYYLPERILTNEQLAIEYPEWPAERIEAKLGIVERHIAAENECSSDLGVKAAEGLFTQGKCDRDDIDFLLFCTQSPDYFLPTSACLIQHRLGIPKTAGALDFNLGCSGFIYGLSLAKSLVESGQARNVLLITAETYSKFIHPGDKSVRTLFGDAGAATLIQGVENDGIMEYIGPFIYGTDGSGGKHLIVPAGGMRMPRSQASAEVTVDSNGNLRSADNLYMNGTEIFNFSLQTVPATLKALLEKAGKTAEEIDLFVYHQANAYMLEYLRKKSKLPKDKFYLALRHYGNTVSCTIPIALKDAVDEGKLGPGGLVAIIGFGVGLSWGATLVRWLE